MDILLEQTSWNGQSTELPLRSDQAPWKEIVSLRESRGEQVFLKKITKALKKSMPRLKKKATNRWMDDALSLRSWNQLNGADQALRRFWETSLQQPESEAGVTAFQNWIENRGSERSWSIWETWHLLSVLFLCGRQLPDGLFWELWNLAAKAFGELRGELDPPEGAEGALDEFLISSVELRWLALAVFPEIEHASRLPKEARRALASWGESFLTAKQTPAAEDLGRLPDLWHSFARTTSVCSQLQQNPFRKSERRMLRKLLTATCRLAGPAGGLLSTSAAVPWSFLHELSEEVAAKKPLGLKSLLKTYATQEKSLGKVSRTRKQVVPDLKPSHQTDEGKWAVLRSKWIDSADACLVCHDSVAVQLNLEITQQQLLSGDWELELECRGKTVPLRDSWEAVCWHSDRDGVYLELQQTVDEDVTVERQLFLSRQDHFLYFADVIHAPDDREITVRSALPLTENLRAEQDRYTREWKLKRKKKTVARLFPLAFEQEIVQKTPGTLSASTEGPPTITMERTARGSLFLPGIIDWHPRHLAAPAEWRKLTITQSRQVSPAAVAGGYRLRLAEQHLLVYRSLQEPVTPRAILGHHTLNESLLAKFDEDGEVDPLLIVE